MSKQVSALVIVTVPDDATEDATLDTIETAVEATGLAGVYVEPYIGPAHV